MVDLGMECVVQALYEAMLITYVLMALRSTSFHGIQAMQAFVTAKQCLEPITVVDHSYCSKMTSPDQY